MPKDKKELEERAYTVALETRESESGESVVEGRPIVFGEYADIGGWFRETIDRGALDETDLTDVRLLVSDGSPLTLEQETREP